jgi:hypothetical protein
MLTGGLLLEVVPILAVWKLTSPVLQVFRGSAGDPMEAWAAVLPVVFRVMVLRVLPVQQLALR